MTHTPSETETPSSKKLIISSVVALIAATTIVLTVVLPAEYAIDPTGVGKATGLMQMGIAKKEMAYQKALHDGDIQSVEDGAAKSESDSDSNNANVPSAYRDQLKRILRPGEGVEVSLSMNEGDEAKFYWETTGGDIHYETHALIGDQFISYDKGAGDEISDGKFTADSKGDYGWSFLNKNESQVLLILRTGGDYDAVNR